MIEAYRIQPWRISRIGRRMSQQIAICHVLYPAAGLLCRENGLQHSAVLRVVHRLHTMWFNRAKELIVNRLWIPGADEHSQSQLWTYRRVLHCRPSCVFFRNGNQAKIRPCRRHKVCPFCWARVAAMVYRQFKSRIRQARAAPGQLVVTCRVLSKHVPAENFCPSAGLTAEHGVANMRRLKDIFDQHKTDYASIAKQLQRKTRGSACRVVVDATETGWTVEIRQFFLAPAGTALPVVKDASAEVVFLQSAKATDDEKLETLFGRFLTYPPGLLTAYSELVAVYLNASHEVRMTTGTGLFRTSGQGLTAAFKQEKEDGEIQVQHRQAVIAPVRAAVDPDAP